MGLAVSRSSLVSLLLSLELQKGQAVTHTAVGTVHVHTHASVESQYPSAWVGLQLTHHRARFSLQLPDPESLDPALWVKFALVRKMSVYPPPRALPPEVTGCTTL